MSAVLKVVEKDGMENKNKALDAAHPEAIRTVRGIGYMFVPPKD